MALKSKKHKKLEHFKNLKVNSRTPKDLSIAIQTFIKQAVIIGENSLDSMPAEYTSNLLKTLSKYPEYNKITLDIIDIINQKK
tara:strand:+ start:776 stop:1024 length:249 start_codon:yes stop_codon:yes gene_type:complete